MNALERELKIGIENALQLNQERVNSDKWRLKYHVMPPIGWLNDPNGVCEFNGTYHLFYQYSPLDTEGGLKYWGHTCSHDMVNFEDQGVKLFPDRADDVHGIYSGSAFVENNKIHFFYTGNVKKSGNYDFINSGREQNTIYAVSEDGSKITKQNTVIKADHYPEGFSTHIRDPKVFTRDGKYYMVLGARDINSKGQVLLYQADNLENWSFKSIFAGPYPNLGYMWECPDFFSLSQKDVLLISPQGIKPQGHLYNNVHQSGYFIGQGDFLTGKFEPSSDFIELDCGFDLYAPQTFCDSKGRRIMWAWMGLPDIENDYTNPTVEKGWQHAMAIPRQLMIKDGKLIQKPLEEYKKLRKGLFERSIDVIGRTEKKGLNGEVYELIIDFEEIEEWVKIELRQDTVISYNKKDKFLSLSHGSSGYGRSVRKTEVASLNKLQIFSDTSSLEIFVNDGEKVFTTRVYPGDNQNTIVFDGQGKLQVKKWNLT